MRELVKHWPYTSGKDVYSTACGKYKNVSYNESHKPNRSFDPEAKGITCKTCLKSKKRKEVITQIEIGYDGARKTGKENTWYLIWKKDYESYFSEEELKQGIYK